jgi:hypothetical protein
MKDNMFLEALRRNEGFRRETDKAFTKFWEREGDSLRKRELIELDANGNTISRTLLGELIEKPDSDPYVLDAYCNSPEARHVGQKYDLYRPFHYNYGLPGQLTVVSGINFDGSVGIIDGQNVWIFRCPCLRAITNQSLNRLDIKIDLAWPKQEIMNIVEMVLDDAFQKRESAGKKTKKRGIEIDPLPFKVWDMHNKNGMTPWEITKELFPFIKDKSINEGDKTFSPFARSHLRKVERALEKANKLIASITPAN